MKWRISIKKEFIISVKNRKKKLTKTSFLNDFVIPYKTLNEIMKIVGDDEDIEIFPYCIALRCNGLACRLPEE